MATGTATINFGSTPVDEGSVTVTGQTGILAASSHVEAFFMVDTTGDHTVDEHQEAAVMCPLVCGNIVDNTSFTIYAHTLHAAVTGQFKIRWVWT